MMTLVQPSPEQQIKIRSELNENVTTRDQDLEHIKEWFRRQPHLPYFDGIDYSASFTILFSLNLSAVSTNIHSHHTAASFLCPKQSYFIEYNSILIQ